MTDQLKCSIIKDRTLPFNVVLSQTSGHYLVTYEIDIIIPEEVTTQWPRVSSMLALDGVMINGSHLWGMISCDYKVCLSATVLVDYIAGQKIGIYWWVLETTDYQSIAIKNVAVLTINSDQTENTLSFEPLPVGNFKPSEAHVSLSATYIIMKN